MLASLFLIGALSTTPQMSVQAASQTIVDTETGGVPGAINRTLGGIISYVRWPAPIESGKTFCVVGAPRLTDRIAPDPPGRGPAVAVRRTTVAAVTSTGDCDILFLGRMPDADRNRLIGWVRNRPILTISDDDPDCLHGAMFCLAYRRGALSFSVNLDAIARGRLRIDPRVLKIGQGDGGGS